MSAAHDASAVPADLVACLAAIGRSMDDAFDPRKFLGEFSTRLQRLIRHDRLVIAYLDDDRRTFTVFAEHAAKGPVLHAEHYTTGFRPRDATRSVRGRSRPCSAAACCDSTSCVTTTAPRAKVRSSTSCARPVCAGAPSQARGENRAAASSKSE
jgi:hypothetical protein